MLSKNKMDETKAQNIELDYENYDVVELTLDDASQFTRIWRESICQFEVNAVKK